MTGRPPTNLARPRLQPQGSFANGRWHEERHDHAPNPTLGAVGCPREDHQPRNREERPVAPGAHIRHLMDGAHGNMIHSTVPPGMVGRACHFRTIEEYWYVLAGVGEIWRRDADGSESVTRLIPGVSVDIPLGTA